MKSQLDGSKSAHDVCAVVHLYTDVFSNTKSHTEYALPDSHTSTTLLYVSHSNEYHQSTCTVQLEHFCNVTQLVVHSTFIEESTASDVYIEAFHVHVDLASSLHHINGIDVGYNVT
jgi:hypothetical protein